MEFKLKTAFPPIVDDKSRLLILGTMPGDRSLALQQYYGHAGNHFWKIMFALFNQQYTKDYTVKKQLLTDKGIALWDVLQSCECEGSSDSNIKNEQPNDFPGFYSTYPTIKNIFFASKKAQELYEKYVGKDAGKNYFLLPSPSSANTWKTFGEKLNEWEIVKSVSIG